MVKDPAELWFLAAQAWSRAYLADDETRREQNLAERAFRATLKARSADPERAARALEMAEAPDNGELFDGAR